MSFQTDYQTEWAAHQVGSCAGLSASCLSCITDGYNVLIRRGVTVKAIQEAIIAHNDDTGEAIEEMLE